MIKNMRNKMGWIKIVEAFIAIMLIAGMVLVVIGKREFKTEDSFFEIHKTEISMLRDIQLNDSLREDILLADIDPLPAGWGSQEFPTNVQARIIEKTPSQLECQASICPLDDDCVLENRNTDVFAESVIISATLEDFSPRKLKLFCWGKN